jgi:hypothetical protein
MISTTAELKSFPVFGPHGQIGEVLASSRFLDNRPEKTIRLLDGREFQAPSSALQIQDDGSFYFTSSESLDEARDVSVPNDKQGPPTADAPAIAPASPKPAPPQDLLFEMGYDVETVRVDRMLDGPVSQRQEGDVLILPVIEEVWVIEKKLLLREEIRITPRKKQVDHIRTIEK